MADLRDVILARLDDLADEHPPCEPGVDCLHRALDGIRAAVVFAGEHPGMILLEPVLLARIGEELGIQHGEVVSGG